MEYRCVATSVKGFVQQLAVAYITHGYWFYVAGNIPEGKDPSAVDAKLISRYGVAISKWARCRRKKQGLANMQYLRHDRFFVLLATKGRHEFFERERTAIRDVRRVSIKFADYKIGCSKGRDGRWHASVRIEAQPYLDMKTRMLEAATWRKPEALVDELREIQFTEYAPTHRQVLTILRAINRKRASGCLPPVPLTSTERRHRVLSPFADSE